MSELDEVSMPDVLLDAAIQGYGETPCSLGHRQRMCDALKAVFNHRDYSFRIQPSRTRLTRQEIVAIREKYATGKFKQYELAEGYGVTASSISRIVNGKSFSQVYE